MVSRSRRPHVHPSRVSPDVSAQKVHVYPLVNVSPSRALTSWLTSWLTSVRLARTRRESHLWHRWGIATCTASLRLRAMLDGADKLRALHRAGAFASCRCDKASDMWRALICWRLFGWIGAASLSGVKHLVDIDHGAAEDPLMHAFLCDVCHVQRGPPFAVASGQRWRP